MQNPVCIVLFLCVLASPVVHAQWNIVEDVSLGSPQVVYKSFKDAWVVTFERAHTESYDLLVPQLCVGKECELGQIQFSHVSCTSVTTLLIDAAWFNENAQSDIVGSDGCLLSLQDMDNAQILLGSVMPEPYLYVSVPTSITIHNNETFLRHFDRAGSAGEWNLVVRLLFLTELDIGSERIFGVRRYVADVRLSKPDLSFATLEVQSACALVGLRAPRDAQLHMRIGADGAVVCVWTCRVDAMRTTWNLPPNPDGAGECRPLPSYFTAVEFAFTISTELPASNWLAQTFYDDLDAFAGVVEGALGASSLVALTVPGSDFDTVRWREWVHDYVAFSHRQETSFTSNTTLLIEALRSLGLYTEVTSPEFAYRGRRFTTLDIVVTGVWFTPDVSASVLALVSRLMQTIEHTPHSFREEMRVRAIAQVDVARVHRLAPLYSREAEIEVRMQRNGVLALEFLCLCALVMTYVFYRCRRHSDE